MESVAKLNSALANEEAVRKIICKGASDGEWGQFVQVLKVTGLNPYLREIYWLPNIGPYISHKGMLRIASRSQQYDGMQTKIFYQDADGAISETNYTGKLILAKCEVFRKDRSRPDVFEAFYSEYKKDSTTWNKYPRVMLAAKAEKGALSKAFQVDGVSQEQADLLIDDDAIPEVIQQPEIVMPANVAPKNTETLIGLRSEFRALIVKISSEFQKETSIDVLTAKALNADVRFSDLSNFEDIKAIEAGVAYAKEYLAKVGGK